MTQITGKNSEQKKRSLWWFGESYFSWIRSNLWVTIINIVFTQKNTFMMFNNKLWAALKKEQCHFCPFRQERVFSADRLAKVSKRKFPEIHQSSYLPVWHKGPWWLVFVQKQRDLLNTPLWLQGFVAEHLRVTEYRIYKNYWTQFEHIKNCQCIKLKRTIFVTTSEAVNSYSIVFTFSPTFY